MENFQDLNLLKYFTPHTYELWKKAVDKQLKGIPFEKKLIKKTYENIDILPAYFEQDVKDLPQINALPGFSPFVRSTKPLGYLTKAWEIAQELYFSDAHEFNRIAKLDLSRGQTVLNILFDKKILQDINLQDFEIAFESFDLEKIPVFLQAQNFELKIISILKALFKTQNKNLKNLNGAIFFDPISNLASNGVLNVENAYKEMAYITNWAIENNLNFKTIGVQSCVYHDSGASCVEELAICLAIAAEYIRNMLKLENYKFDINKIAQKIIFSFSIGNDFFMEIAKLRAFRLLWENFISAFGENISEDSKKPYIHARTSKFNKTLTDAYVNMLRVTTETFAAICGGADSIHVGPFDEIATVPSDFSRRIARNVQIVLKDECHVDKVADLAGGSWYVEKITNDLCEKSWALFQEIEKQDGILKALESNFIQEKIQKVSKERAKNIETRKDVLIGTNKYPNLKETPIQINPPINKTEHKISVKALNAYRAGEKFENLRKTKQDKVFLANMGPVSQHKARADFSFGFFSVGGFDIINHANGFESTDKACAEVLKSNAKIVVICSTDETYPSIVPDLAGKIKKADPNIIVILAGYPTDFIESFKKAGIDEFIHIRSNVYQILLNLQNKLKAS